MAKKRIVRIAGEKVKKSEGIEVPEENKEDLISKILEENPEETPGEADEADEVGEIVDIKQPVVSEPEIEESIPTEDFNSQLKLLMKNRHKQSNPQAYAKEIVQTKSASVGDIIIEQQSAGSSIGSIRVRGNSVVTSRSRPPVTRSSSGVALV